MAALLALAVTTAATPARAQDQPPAGAYLDGGVAAARIRSAAGAVVQPLHGVVLAFSGAVSRWGLVVEGRYAQGSLSSADPAVEKRDLVEGELHFGVKLLPAITVLAGPHARAYAAASGSQRWVFWEARVAGTAPVIPSRLDVYAELWGAVAGSTSLSNGFGSERGGEVGARVELPRTPLALRIAYRIDHGSGTDPVRSDTAEQLVIALRLRSR